MTDSSVAVVGKVVGLGARYVIIPPRLVPEARGIELWGREVTVEIPHSSHLLLAEKVLISPKYSLSLGFLDNSALAEDAPAHPTGSPQPVEISPELAAKTSFGASGAVYLPDLKKFRVVSDDTDAAKTPWLFLLSPEGKVDEQPLLVPGVSNVVDFLEKVQTFNLELQLLTQYRRRAFLSAHDAYARVTFDIDLKYYHERRYNVHPDQALMQNYDHPDTYEDYGSGRNVILELKCERKIPSWMIVMIRTFQLTHYRFSKFYGAMIEGFGQNDRMLTYQQARQ